jgi:hypothetical protein
MVSDQSKEAANCGGLITSASIGMGLAAPTSFGAGIVATILIAPATALIHTALVVVSVATTVPALSAPVTRAAIVQARAIPAIHVETNRDFLHRIHAVNRDARWGAQRRRGRTAWQQRSCRQDDCRRGESQKKSTHLFVLLMKSTPDRRCYYNS